MIRFEDWSVAEVVSDPAGRFVTLSRADGAARITVVVAPTGYARAIVRCAAGDLYYRDAQGLDGGGARDLVLAFAERVDRGELVLDDLGAHGGDGPFAGWRVREVKTDFFGKVFVELTRGDGAARIIVGVAPRGYPQALVRSRAGDLYLDAAAGVAPEVARAALERFGALLDEGAIPLPRLFPHLALDRGAARDPRAARRALLDAVTARALSAPAEVAPSEMQVDVPLVSREPSALALARAVPLRFDPPGIADFFSPELTLDGPAVARHVLRAVYLPPVARRAEVRMDSYYMDFESVVDRQITRVQVRAGAPEGAAFVAPQGLSFGPMGVVAGTAIPPDVASLCSWLVALVYLKAPAGLALEVPARVEDLRALSVPEGAAGRGAGAPRGDDAPASLALNLALDADCQQRCAFCSVKSYVTPTDKGDAELAEVLLQLRDARAQGVEVVRLNGIDPVAHSRVVDIARAARDAGFTRMEVFSPGRRFADRAFLDAFLDAAPRSLEVTVPLYGVTARTHDAVVGVEGAHAEVTRAIGLLRAASPRVRLRVSTVVVRGNVDELAATWLFSQRLGAPFDARLSYPMRSTVRDVYAESAIRESEVVERAAAQAERLTPTERRTFYAGVGALITHPCVLFRAEQARGVPALGAREVTTAPQLPGTEYRSRVFLHGGDGSTAFVAGTVPCPHAARCALASVCSREVYSVYADLFGLDELQPVTPRALYLLTPAPLDEPTP